MYTLKPVVVHDFAVEIPKCMYRLSNIHSPRKVDGSEEHVSSPAKKLDIFDQVKQFLKVLYHFFISYSFLLRFMHFNFNKFACTHHNCKKFNCLIPQLSIFLNNCQIKLK